jgi:predicted O-methyltransferase YrrM
VTDGGSSVPEVRALLRVLATGRDVAELGAAFGEGAAAMAETARSVVTVELDPDRVAAARRRFAGLPAVEVLEGDWRDALRGRCPFGLVFADGGLYD